MNDYLFSKPNNYIESDLKKLWRCEQIIMIGEYQHSSSSKEIDYGYISNPFINDRNIYYPDNDHKRSVAIRVSKSKDLVEGNYYKIKAKLAPIELRKQINNPYLLVWDESQSIIGVADFLSPKEFITSWFHQTGSTPKDAATIASQLKLNSLELYTQTERFIFELIQNADDMPSSHKGVSVQLHLLENFLLFRHNGKFFDRDDVKAIADAAQSNKAENVRQTGYKGIGFKSVFTDSSCVYIKSGSYSFKFDKNDNIYSDFWNLYSWHTKLLSHSPKDFELFKVDYEKNKEKYDNIDNIPWQIKPIWVKKDQFPHELVNSDFFKHAEVNIALEISENIIKSKKYAFMIESILAKPKFILFLRNTVRFDYFILDSKVLRRQQSIEIYEHNNLIDILHNQEQIASFSKTHFDIEINNYEFNKAGFTIEKYEDKPGFYKFKDEYGEIKSIPEKLGSLSSTRITFASQIVSNEIVKLEQSQSILYNYLPTSDQRFGFPFLINADFITNTSREFILTENKWNQYLMYHIGLKSVECFATLCAEEYETDGVKGRKYINSYLNLLPESLLNEDNEELSEINKSFNRGFLNSLNKVAFIVNSQGLIKTISEIIIDETRISDVLGFDFFKSFSDSIKELPFFLIDNLSLNKEYLDIEKYSADLLIIHLQNKEKQEILKKTISILSPEKYKTFLNWVDQFYSQNRNDDSWLLSLPFIRKLDVVISLNDCLSHSDFIFRTSKTIEIEDILQKLGFILSDFSLDEVAYKHIRQIVLIQDTYIKNDVKLYEHITTGKDFNKISSNEKNSLLVFFEKLDEVGKAKYAKSLSLFKSKKIDSGLSPLATLISNNCENLPVWLTDLMIDKEDETALDDIFKKHLLKRSDLLDKIFCNPLTFNEIKSKMNLKNIDDFYTFLLKLQNEKPLESKIDYSQIPWLYIPKLDKFKLASEVYCPDSFLKLDIDKYESIRNIIEALTDEVLPYFNALAVKKEFVLGCRAHEISVLKLKPYSGSTIPINDLLDWLELNNEKEFFKKIYITENIDHQSFTLNTSLSQFQYYTDDKQLIEYINSFTESSKLILLPSDLYTESRFKIGLLEGDKLLQYLINNSFFSTGISKFVHKSRSKDIFKLFFDKIAVIDLISNTSYAKDSNESIIFKMLLDLGQDDNTLFETIKPKIKLDNQGILEKSFSDDVFMEYKHDEVFHKIEFKLSELLPSYKDQTASVNAMVESFPDLNKTDLRKIFGLSKKKPKSVFEELHGLKQDYFNAIQAVFLITYKLNSNASKVFFDKSLFTKNYSVNTEIYQKEATIFIDLCYRNGITFYTSMIKLPDFEANNKISIQDYVFNEEETLPEWLKIWLNDSDTDKKIIYLKMLGVQTNDSHIVRLRKGLLDSDKDSFDKGLPFCDNKLTLSNSIKWIAQKQKEKNLVLTREFLQPLYNKLYTLSAPIPELLFPILLKYKINSYQLVVFSPDIEIHQLNEKWEPHTQVVFDFLIKNNKYIIDDVLPDGYKNRLNRTRSSVKVELDKDDLVKNSTLLDEEYYNNWEFREAIKLYLYKDNALPYKVIYSNYNILSYTENVIDRIEGNFYIVYSKREALHFLLEGKISIEKLNSLIAAKAKYEAKKKKEEKEIKYSSNEEQALKKLFGNDIPPEFFKDLNLSACVSALVVMHTNGYNVETANINLTNSHEYAQITPVFLNESNLPFTVMCRSARSGILYLTAQAWDRLNDDNILLFVKTGQNDNNYFLFNEKKDILTKSNTKYQVFRVEAESNYNNTDSILNGTFDKDKIWLIFKMKENDSYRSIFDGEIRRIEDNPDYVNIMTTEDSKY